MSTRINQYQKDLLKFAGLVAFAGFAIGFGFGLIAVNLQ